MQNKRYTKVDILSITREAIHLFIKKHIDSFAEFLDEDFVFIADYEPLFLQGRSEFLRFVRAEKELPPVDISMEEYVVTAHERRLWTCCGRYLASAKVDGVLTASKHHFTFVWMQQKNDLKLVHAMACHAKGDAAPEGVQAKIFDDTAHRIDTGDASRVALRAVGGKTHYLRPNEIVYVEADNKLCRIHTETEVIVTRSALYALEIPNSILIHKSFLVNRYHIKDICRYSVTLLNGTVLPIGKSRYDCVRAALTQS